MIVEVVIPLGKTLKSTLKQVEREIKKAKKAMPYPCGDIATYGPKKMYNNDVFTALQYRLATRELGAKVWCSRPDSVVGVHDGTIDA